jgi:hypothetical protein
MRFFLALVLVCSSALAQGILVDHRDVAAFDSIPPGYYDAARQLRLLFMDRSVGGNISDALSCLASPWTSAPSFCKRYQHRDSAYAVSPSEVQWKGTWDRSRWRYEFWPTGCSEDADCFVDFVEPRIDSFDVVGFQFSYLAVQPGSDLADPARGFFSARTDVGTDASYAAFAARHADKRVIWWTTSLARGIGSAESQSFNDAMRAYARSHDIVLFDVADILSHDPSGAPCYDNRDGVAYLTENHPDDSLDIPAICPQYTTETDGGHLGSISAGGIRVAKAFWVLMARIAGWKGSPDTTRPFDQTPLTEMGPALYKGMPGGLYPGAANTRPPAHDAAGIAVARSIVPLDTLGMPDAAGGRTVLLSIGMSNTTQEFSAFVAMSDTFARKHPRLVVVDGAQGGQTAAIIRNPQAAFWTTIDQRLRSKRVTPQQVQAVWLKEANAGPTQAFPLHATMLQDDLKTIVSFLLDMYPNLKLVFLSSRIYGGYASTQLNPEPYAFESGFSVRWLIEQQIAGDTALAFEGPARRAPWLAWGPYLWGNGRNPRLEDGLVWLPGDLSSDGTHPSTSGRLKVAEMLLRFFSTDAAATPWFLRDQASRAGDAPQAGDLRLAVAPNPAGDVMTVVFSLPRTGRARLELYNLTGASVRVLFEGEAPAGARRLVFPLRGSGLPAGIYFLRLTSDAGSATARCALW